MINEKGGKSVDTPKKGTSIPGILLIVGSLFGALFWLAMLFFSFFLGGSPGPGYERTVPYYCVAIIGLGFAAAIIGLIAGIKSIIGSRLSIMVFIAIPLGAAGSIPFFLLSITKLGIIALLFGLFPPLLYLFLSVLTRKTKQTKHEKNE